MQTRETELPPKTLTVNEKLLNKIVRGAQDCQTLIKEHFSLIPQVLYSFIHGVYAPEDSTRFVLI